MYSKNISYLHNRWFLSVLNDINSILSPTFFKNQRAFFRNHYIRKISLFETDKYLCFHWYKAFFFKNCHYLSFPKCKCSIRLLKKCSFSVHDQPGAKGRIFSSTHSRLITKPTLLMKKKHLLIKVSQTLVMFTYCNAKRVGVRVSVQN